MKDTARNRHRLTKTRTKVLVLAVIGLLLVPMGLVPPAEAQFAVFDVANLAQNILTALRTAEAILQRILVIQNQIAQIEHMVTNLKDLEDPRVGSILTVLNRLERAMEEQTKGLLYSQRLLNLRYLEIYRWQPAARDLFEEDRKRVETSLETARAALIASQLQSEDLERAQARLGGLTSQILDAEGNLQALQALALVEAHTAQEVSKLTQQMLVRTNLDAVAFAHEVASRSSAEGTFREAVEASREDVPLYAATPPIPVVPTNYRR